VNWMSGKAGLWLCLSIAATGVLAAVPTAQQSDRAEQILNRSCTVCHDLRPIQVQALDTDGWTTLVNTKIEKGAQVQKDDVPIVVEYLVNNHGPLPDGRGKPILLNICTLCHDLKRVKQHGATAEEWEETLIAMLNEGAPLSDQDFPVLLNYLARNFPPVQ